MFQAGSVRSSKLLALFMARLQMSWQMSELCNCRLPLACPDGIHTVHTSARLEKGLDYQRHLPAVTDRIC